MLKAWEPRISSYRQLAAGILHDHKKEFEAMVGCFHDTCNDPVDTVWHAVHEHFFGEPAAASSGSATDDFVNIGIKMRNLHAADHLASVSDESASWTRKMTWLLCMAGKLKSALDTFVKVATTDWQGYTINLVPITCTPSPAEIANRN